MSKKHFKGAKDKRKLTLMIIGLKWVSHQHLRLEMYIMPRKKGRSEEQEEEAGSTVERRNNRGISPKPVLPRPSENGDALKSPSARPMRKASTPCCGVLRVRAASFLEKSCFRRGCQLWNCVFIWFCWMYREMTAGYYIKDIAMEFNKETLGLKVLHYL